jgi:hypothetical protein
MVLDTRAPRLAPRLLPSGVSELVPAFLFLRAINAFKRSLFSLLLLRDLGVLDVFNGGTESFVSPDEEDKAGGFFRNACKEDILRDEFKWVDFSGLGERPPRIMYFFIYR